MWTGCFRCTSVVWVVRSWGGMDVGDWPQDVVLVFGVILDVGMGRYGQ